MCDNLKDDILVVFVTQQVFAVSCFLGSLLGLTLCICCLCRLLLLSYRLFSGSISLLLGRHLLQAVELFTI